MPGETTKTVAEEPNIISVIGPNELRSDTDGRRPRVGS